MLQLTFMYLPLCFYLVYHFRCKGKYTEIAIWKLFVCAVVDSQATICIVLAYSLTSITSVMIIEDFSIPSAVVLSVLLLKVSYSGKHWLGIAVCVCGISLGFTNDFLFFKSTAEASKPILGDLLALVGAFLYALENVLQEYLIKKKEDVFNFLGFIGLFGALITLAEATITWEFTQFQNIVPGDGWKVGLNFFGMAAVNFVTYTIIPFYVTRSGATLLNLSNVTTIIWSMLSDIMLFQGQFYPLCLAAFALEIVGIVIFSTVKPVKKVVEQPIVNELSV